MRARRWAAAGAAAVMAGAIAVGYASWRGGGGGSTSGDAGVAFGRSAEEVAALSAGGAQSVANKADGSAGAGTIADVDPKNRQLVYTAEVGVRVADVAAALREAERLITAAGGFVSGENATATPDDEGSSTGRLTLEVPPARYRALLTQLGRLGDQLSVNSTVEDVTDAVVDVEARIRAQSDSVARMRTLLARARTVGEVVTVESELSRRLADLEALQARQQSLAGQVRYATVTASFYGPSSLDAGRDDAGFVAGLRAGWAAFTGSVVAVLTGLGAALPFVVLLALLWVPARLAWRALRRRGAAAGQPAADSTAG
jgi:Domain of unknown function (DUF4349)